MIVLVFGGSGSGSVWVAVGARKGARAVLSTTDPKSSVECGGIISFLFSEIGRSEIIVDVDTRVLRGWHYDPNLWVYVQHGRLTKLVVFLSPDFRARTGLVVPVLFDAFCRVKARACTVVVESATCQHAGFVRCLRACMYVSFSC